MTRQGAIDQEYMGPPNISDGVVSISESRIESPQPLIREMDPPEPFPIDAMGSLLGSATRAIEDRTRAPDAMCAQSVLAACALGVQGFADIELPTGRSRPVSCFFFSVGATGERKSAVDSDALWPVVNREKALRERYEEDLPLWRNAEDAWEKQRAQILADKKLKTQSEKRDALDELGQAPTAPLVPILTAGEPTLEGLHRLYATGHPSLGLFSAEGGSFVGGHGMTVEKKLLTAAGLSELWDGSPIRRVRAGDGASILPGKRLSLHLMAQPDIAGAFLSDRILQDQGLMSRILIVSPQSTVGGRFWRDPTPESEAEMRQYWAQLSRILEYPEPLAENTLNELAPRNLQMAPQARLLWIKFADHIERLMGAGAEMESIRGLANKLPEHAARLASVLCLFRNVEAGDLSSEFMESGIEIVQHYAAEALRLHYSGMVDPKRRLALDALNWMQTSWPEVRISLPDLYQRGPRSIRDKGVARGVVSILEDHGWLQPVDGGATINGQYRREAWQIMEG